MDKVDPFTLRMLERARLRQEKLESKLQPSERATRNKKPLTETNNLPEVSLKAPDCKESPARNKDNQENVVTRSTSVRGSGTLTRTNLTRCGESAEAEVAVEIQIVHQNNVQVEVQVEERHVKLSDYLKEKEKRRMEGQSGCSTSYHSLSSADNIPLICGAQLKTQADFNEDFKGKSTKDTTGRAEISQDGKSRLKKLGRFYSDDPKMSSPVTNRTEIKSYLSECHSNNIVSSSSNTSEGDEARRNARAKKGPNKRFAALADHINNMEDDLRHIDFRTKDAVDTKKSKFSSLAAKVSSSTSSESGGKPPRRSLGKSSVKTPPKATETTRSPRQSISNIKSSKLISTSDSSSTRKSLTSSPKSALVGVKSPRNSLLPKQSPRQSMVKEVKNSPPVRRSPRQSIINSYASDGNGSPSARIQEAREKFQSISAKSADKKQPRALTSKSPMKWDRTIIEDLESKGFKRVSVSQSRLVYDFSSSNHQQAQGDKTTPAPLAVANMAAVAVTSPAPGRITRNNITKRPSIKKHKAPQPPKNVAEKSDNEKENSSSDIFMSSMEDLLNGKSETSSEQWNGDREREYSTCSASQHSIDTISSNHSSPLARHKKLAEHSNGGSPGGNVMTKAAIFETKFDSPRNTEPSQMSIRERKALFEKNKGHAPLPKAAFGMAPPIKVLHASHNNDRGGVTKKPILSSINLKPKIEPKPEVPPIHSATARLGNISYKMAHVLQPSMGEKDIMDKTKKQRDEELMMLKNRFNRRKEMNTDFDSIETEIDHEEQTSEDSPLMGGGDSRVARVAKKDSSKEGEDEGETETDAVVGSQPTKRRSSTDAPQVVSALEDVKRIKVTKPREGGLYPCLSDIEQPTTEDEKQSCLASSLNTSSDSAPNEHINDDNWGDTSFGREVLSAVGVKKPLNTSNKSNKTRDVIKEVRRNREKEVAKSRDDSDASSCNNSELDDLLDEVLEDESEGPTPPKQNKNVTTQPSNSFSYKKGSEVISSSDEERFKSPLKTPPRSEYEEAMSSGKPLVHTISFYRRQQQSQGSQNSTPVRVVKREDETESARKVAEEVAKKKAEKNAATDARAKVKELMEEVTKQNTIISQASQALNLCASTIEFSGSTEQAEGERLLLLASHRRQACLHEIQRLQVEGLPSHTSQLITLRMEKFSLPLRREYVRQLNADGALGHYFVCLVKCQERVIATSMMKSAPDSFSVTFPDKVRFEGLDPNFKITVEVYALQASKEVLPHDIKYHIATKKSGKLATPRKGCKGADLKAALPITSPGGPAAVRAPSFQPNGYCIFGYSQISRNTFSLNKGNVSGPLDGSLKVNLSIEKRVVSLPPRAPKRGFLTMFEESGGFGAWHRRWCVLHGQDLSYWRYPDHEGSKPPMGTVEFSTIISEKVIPAPRELCARPHTVFFESSTGEKQEAVTSPNTRRSMLCLKTGDKVTHLLAADTKMERDDWIKAFNIILSDVRAMME